MNAAVFVILTALAFGLAVTAKEPQCYFKGECLNSQLVNLTKQDSYNKCLKDCQHNMECQWFTFEGSQNSCLLFSDCNTISDSTCQHCYSGQKTCQPKLDCNLNGICQVKTTLILSWNWHIINETFAFAGDCSWILWKPDFSWVPVDMSIQQGVHVVFT